MKSFHYSRTTVELNEASIAELFRILDIDKQLDAEVARFILINFPKDRNFYHLVSHVLTMNGVSTVIAPPFDWEPANLFYQLGKVLKGHQVELLSSAKNEVGDAYDITFSLDGTSAAAHVDIKDPSALFEAANKYLTDHQFVRLVSHLKQRRSPEWMLIPIPFDSEAFKNITGCTEVKEEWKPD